MGKLEENLKNIRSNYAQKELNAEETGADPFVFAQKWLHEAIEAEVMEPNAMDLATVDEEGRPSVRIVLLRNLDDRGFVFFTNYNSNKGVDIDRSGLASLNFFWPELERQLRVDGKVERVEQEVSDDYFASRPRESRIGAWVSDQSAPIENREQLESRYKKLEKEYEGKEVPRPPHWGGYRVLPMGFEFWQGRMNRLHDRIRFEKEGDKWSRSRLAP